MKMERLIPFENFDSAISISAGAKLSSSQVLDIVYEVKLTGDMNSVSVDDSSTYRAPMVWNVEQRRDELWKKNCFEAFLKPNKSTEDYLEMNFSPLGFWNAYHFESYRQGMKKEARIEKVFTQSEKRDDERKYSFQIDLGPFKIPAWKISLVAVYGRSHRLDYWALRHGKAKPDFHLPETFVYEI